MNWMSDHTISGLQAKRAELMQSVQEIDKAAEQARQELMAAEQKLSMCKGLAEGARKELAENAMLLAIAQGNAPVPSPGDIRVTDDGLALALGGLRIAMVPDDATPEQLQEFAETMRTLYAAAGSLAHRADESAKAAVATRSARPWTPDRTNPDGSTSITMKRACNGCGTRLGDVTDEEINAGVEGRPLPDVRDECPRCNGTTEREAGQPVAGQDPYRPPSPAAPTIQGQALGMDEALATATDQDGGTER